MILSKHIYTPIILFCLNTHFICSQKLCITKSEKILFQILPERSQVIRELFSSPNLKIFSCKHSSSFLSAHFDLLNLQHLINPCYYLLYFKISICSAFCWLFVYYSLAACFIYHIIQKRLFTNRKDFFKGTLTVYC